MTFKAGEQVNIVDITFNRDVQPEGQFNTGSPQSLLVELIAPDGSLFRRVGELAGQGQHGALFIAWDPARWDQPGDYLLTIFGNATQTGPAFSAADDNTPLDGNFDNQPGENLVLPFKAL